MPEHAAAWALMHAASPIRRAERSTQPKNSARIRRRENRNDPFRQHRAVLGDDARLGWWERVRALILLVLMVLVLGLAVAGFIGLVIFAATLLLELLAS